MTCTFGLGLAELCRPSFAFRYLRLVNDVIADGAREPAAAMAALHARRQCTADAAAEAVAGSLRRHGYDVPYDPRWADCAHGA